jgi:predicted nucleic acid-binding Zn ribbon protein
VGLRRTRWSAAGPDKARDPQAFGSALDGWARSRGSSRDLANATVFGRWSEIVGTDIASHATPVSLVDGELLMQAESTAWATQLRLLAPTLLQRINTRVGRGTVSRIRVKGPTGPSWRFGSRTVRGRGQRDTYG